MNRRDDGDQSRFAAEEPLFESVVRPVTVGESEVLTPELLAARKKKKLFIIGGLGFVALLFLLLFVSSGPKMLATPESVPVLDAPQMAQKTRLQLRLEDVRADFRQADPSKQPLLFPPLNYQLDITTND